MTLKTRNLFSWIYSLKLDIHCWGGLGSQLLALAYYLQIKDKFPTRNLRLVLHTGGVTERNSEINFLMNEIEIVVINDFLPVNNSPSNKNYKKKLVQVIRNMIRFILNLLRIVITNEESIYKVNERTLQVRCAYSDILLNRKLILKLATLLEIAPNEFHSDSVGIHFRSGDLSAVKPEALVDLDAIYQLLDNTELDNEHKKILFHSDSKFVPSDLDFNQFGEAEIRQVDTLTTIKELLLTKIFIGTNSKISLWISLFRYGFKIPGEIYLPTSAYYFFKKIVDEQTFPNNFAVYPYKS
jgi:hypothetical protein